MPDSSAQTGATAAISYSSAAGMAFKVGMFAYNLYQKEKAEEQRQRDMALLCRRLDEIEALIQKYHAEDALQATINAFQSNIDTLNGVWSKLDDLTSTDGNDSNVDEIWSDFATAASATDLSLLIKKMYGAFTGESLGSVDPQPFKDRLIPTFCEFVGGKKLETSETAYVVDWFEYYLFQFRKALACWALKEQIGKAFDKELKHLTADDFSKADRESAFSAEDAEEMIAERWGDAISSLMEKASEEIDELSSSRYVEPAPRGKMGGYMHFDRKSGSTSNHQDFDMWVLTGWLEPPKDEDGNPQPLVGVSLVKGKGALKSSLIGFNADVSGLSVAAQYATVDAILNNDVDSVKTLICSKGSKSGATYVEPSDAFLLERSSTKFMQSSAFRRVGDGANALWVATAVRLKKHKIKGDKHRGLVLQFKFGQINIETKEWIAKDKEFELTTEVKFADLFKHTEKRSYDNNPYSDATGTSPVRWEFDGDEEKFALSDAHPRPLTFLSGGRLYRDSDSRVTRIATYPIALLGI